MAERDVTGLIQTWVENNGTGTDTVRLIAIESLFSFLFFGGAHIKASGVVPRVRGYTLVG